MRTPRRTRLAVATVDDVHRLRATFTKEPTLNILPRPDDELERAAEAGWAIMLLYGNELVAHAYAFAVSGSPVVELGGAEVASGFQGHRIQKELLFPVRVAAVLESHGPEVPITTVIDPNNVRSVDNAKAVGFVPWEAPMRPSLLIASVVRSRPRQRTAEVGAVRPSIICHGKAPYSACARCSATPNERQAYSFRVAKGPDWLSMSAGWRFSANRGGAFSGTLSAPLNATNLRDTVNRATRVHSVRGLSPRTRPHVADWALLQV
jgi:hypothetical protein